jgi:hypothetical protein
MPPSPFIAASNKWFLNEFVLYVIRYAHTISHLLSHVMSVYIAQLYNSIEVQGWVGWISNQLKEPVGMPTWDSILALN